MAVNTTTSESSQASDTRESTDSSPVAVPGATNPNLARDRLANERTFLAWLRTAIAIVSLGFVVAKFDIFLLEIVQMSGEARAADVETESNLTVSIGMMLVLSGPVIVGLAAARYLHTDRALLSGRLESHRLIHGIILAITLMSFIAGIGLAVHLLIADPR